MSLDDIPFGPKGTKEGETDIIPFNGRFYINMERPGFNSWTNNGQGYETEQQARDVIDGKSSRFT